MAARPAESLPPLMVETCLCPARIYPLFPGPSFAGITFTTRGITVSEHALVCCKAFGGLTTDFRWGATLRLRATLTGWAHG